MRASNLSLGLTVRADPSLLLATVSLLRSLIMSSSSVRMHLANGIVAQSRFPHTSGAVDPKFEALLYGLHLSRAVYIYGYRDLEWIRIWQVGMSCIESSDPASPASKIDLSSHPITLNITLYQPSNPRE
jgi:hypothetical protein